MKLSAELAEKINAARPQCVDYASSNCRNGDKCQFRHHASLDGRKDIQLPWVSVDRSPKGKISLHLRPPLEKAANNYLSMKCAAPRLSQQMRLAENITMFTVSFMAEPDGDAIANAKLTKSVTTNKALTLGKIIKPDMPKVLMHGTSVEKALFRILCEGETNIQKGECGDGIYLYLRLPQL